jgi:hypothetical protein
MQKKKAIVTGDILKAKAAELWEALPQFFYKNIYLGPEGILIGRVDCIVICSSVYFGRESVDWVPG